MDSTVLYTFLSLTTIFIALKLLSQAISRRRLNLPPSPPALPVIGHLHLLKPLPHRSLHRLSHNLGPVFSLRFGSRLVVVVSSPSAVEECFTINDIVLANRPRLIIAKYLGYNYSTVSAAPYGDYWRNLRRVMALEIFSNSRLNSFASVRRAEVEILLRSLYKNSSAGYARVELKPRFTDLNFNNIMRMIDGKRYYGEGSEDSEKAKEFREIVREIFKSGGASNPADYLPVLRWFDYKGFEKNLKKLHKKMDAFLQRLIDDHRIDKSANSMIDHLLSLQESEPESYSDPIIKGLILVMILAGTDTSSVTLEWAISNLPNHPEVLKKAQVELDTHVGQDRLVSETDLPKLKYLQAIISETLRLFPAVPLLLPHFSSDKCTISGYDVPANTIIIVNAWAIHRDPNVWDEPTTFRPERFEGGDVEGHKLVPFGLGRRSCPGSGLAQRVMGVTLGSLIQCFEWERVSEKAVDMSEGTGSSMPKLEPLEALCKPRGVMNKILSEAQRNI